MANLKKNDSRNKSYNFLDLFAGCGGLSEGFIRAGFEPVAHIEMDVAASNSLRTRMCYHWLYKNKKQKSKKQLRNKSCGN